jgi:tetratricopeptide (TPR) repeat protein
MRKHLLVQMLAALLLFGVGCSSRMAGDAQLRLGNYDAAVQNLQKAVSEDPEDGEALRQLGIAHYRNGDPALAVDALTRALAILPDDPDARYYLGLAELQEENAGAAIQNWRRHFDPAHPRVQEAVNQQLTLVEIRRSIQLARKAIADEQTLKTQAPKPGSVAVFYYYDATPDHQYRYLQKALAAMIITDLSQVKRLTVVERLQVQYLLDEMALGRTDVIDPETAPRTGRLLGAESLVVGTLDSGSIQSETAVASTVKQEVIRTFPVAGEEQDFFVLEKEIVANILETLRVAPTPAEKQSVDKYHTKSFPAVLCYGQALDAQDRGLWKDARAYYQCALDADPKFGLARYGLDHCPADNDPGIAELSRMSTAELAEEAESRIGYARIQDNRAADRQAARAGKGDREDDDDGSSGGGRGDVSVSW